MSLTWCSMLRNAEEIIAIVNASGSRHKHLDRKQLKLYTMEVGFIDDGMMVQKNGVEAPNGTER